MKTKQIVTLLVALTALHPFVMNAQKEFTLEDLNFGGKNYSNMQPENRFLTWWGDELVRLDMDKCAIVDKTTGKETHLFSLKDVSSLTQSDEHNRMRHLYNAEFPYPGESIVKLKNGKELMLVDWKNKQLIAKYNRDRVQAEDWNPASKAFAFVRENNLFVANADGETQQITYDGSREIVYAQSVHRNEFGINKGTFWSPDGMRLCFYRMDQSMVPDYPLVDISSRIAVLQPIKYPMAGTESHKVSVGVYDVQTKKTVWLQTGDNTDQYYSGITWSPDSKKIFLYNLNRDQNHLKLWQFDAATGTLEKTLYEETHPKYVQPDHGLTFLPWDRDKFIFWSEKDGFDHLYLYSLKEGKVIRKITDNSLGVVLDLLGFNIKTRSVIICSAFV